MPSNITYLVESIDPYALGAGFSDITLFLENGIKQLLEHAKEFQGPLRVEATFSEQSVFEGLSVFDAKSERIGAISAYNLEFDGLEPMPGAVKSVVGKTPPEFAAALQSLFNQA